MTRILAAAVALSLAPPAVALAATPDAQQVQTLIELTHKQALEMGVLEAQNAQLHAQAAASENDKALAHTHWTWPSKGMRALAMRATNAHAPCPADTTLDAGTGGTIYDTSGNAWTIASTTQVEENGIVIPSTWNVVRMFWDGSRLFIRNAAGAWYQQPLSNASATAIKGAPAGYTDVASAVTLPQSTFSVELAEDAFQGDAQAQIMVDGTVVAASVTVTASHAANQWQVVSWMGNYGPGTHAVHVTFLNDAYGGALSSDRNLYFASAVVDGKSYTPNYTNLPNTGSQGSVTVTTRY